MKIPSHAQNAVLKVYPDVVDGLIEERALALARGATLTTRSWSFEEPV